MTAIWQNDGTAWRLLSPAGFPDEAALHGLVEHAPHILPLAGLPQMVVVGREVLLGGNWADLIAVEATGRLAIIEIKLARNAEARRAVVAQILTYAAFLRGMDLDALEREILAPHLQKRGFDGLAAAISASDQTGSFDATAFSAGLRESLQEGRFRLVLVLDDAPAELVRLTGYLEAVTDKLLIDLIVVTSYQVGGQQLVVPQRVDAERQLEHPTTPTQKPSTSTGQFILGHDAFAATIAESLPDQQSLLRRLVEWATQLEAEGLVTLGTYLGKANRSTLLPYVPGENAGLVTIWNDKGAALSFWRSVFERRAPASLARIEELPDAPKIGQGTYTRQIPESLLTELTAAYREAANGPIELREPQGGTPAPPTIREGSEEERPGERGSP
jgi:hypothetical protein